ncbi:amino acid adenylation domain-containing protein, partial [Paenibacillus oenotherae]
EDIIIGTPVAGRPHADLEQVIGMFVGTLALRNEVKKEATFLEQVAEVKRRTLEAFEHADYPLEELVEKLDLERDMSRNPLFDTMFAMENKSPIGVVEQEDFHFNPYLEGSSRSKFDLSMQASVHGTGIEISIQYGVSLFRKSTMETMLARFIHLLSEVSSHPEERLEKLSIMREEDHRQLVGFNAARADYPEGMTVHALFEEQAARTPAQTAMIYEGQSLTYRALNEMANRLARKLRGQGVVPNDIVAIMADRSFELGVGMLAVLKSGGAYLAIDPGYPEERIRYIIADSGATTVLVQPHLKAKLASLAEGADLLELEMAEEGDAANLESKASAADMAYVIYTSGSTGFPKGVVVEHRAIVNTLSWRVNEYAMKERDLVLQLFSFSFDGSITSFFTPLLSGARVLLLNDNESKDSQAIKAAIMACGVTHISCVPALYGAILSSAEQGELHSIRFASLGGEMVTERLIAESRAKAPNAEMVNEYGPTENSVITSWLRRMERCGKVTVGVPVPNVQVHILDRCGNIQPVGIAGEIAVAGAGLARGYLNRPELTAEKFINHPFLTEGKLYKTGDWGRWLPDGTIEYAGRIDEQVKIRGYRIELTEIEAKLLAHEKVTEAAVVVSEDEDGGQDLCAYVVTEGNISLGELRRQLGKELPGYMIPSYIVTMDRLPLSPNGKVDRKSLPAPQSSVGEEVYVSPTTELQKMLVEIWQDVLGAGRIGIRDHFFERGGHSLKASALAARIQKELHVSFPLRNVFEAPILEDMAACIEAKKELVFVSINKAAHRDYYPATSAQKRMYILNQLGDRTQSYNMPGAFNIEGKPDVALMEKALDRLIRRHDSLRTTFGMVDGELIQRIHEQTAFKLEHFVEKNGDAPELADSFFRSFDLEQGPLFRACVIEREKESDWFLYDLHHIISDGVSVQVLMEEFVRLYAEEDLLDLDIQYKDYAVWEHERLGDDEMARQEAFWTNTFADGPPLLELPTDYTRPAVQQFEGDTIDLQIDANRTAELRRLAKDTGTTLFMVMLSAYTVLLAKYSGQDDIVVGTPVAGRPHAELDQVIGLFVKTLPMRTSPRQGLSFVSYLQEVKERALLAFGAQDYPLDGLVEKLGLERDVSRNPLFDALFSLVSQEHAGKEESALRLVPFELNQKHAKFDLSLYAAETADLILLTFEFATSLYKRSTINGLGEDYMKVLSFIVENPEASLDEIDLIGYSNNGQAAVIENFSFHF